MKDAVATMGQILPDNTGGRDAVHVAVFSAVSESRLFPGEEVAIAGSTTNPTAGWCDIEVAPARDRSIGIVDPFLRGVILPGDRFWVYLYPRTITGLSHQWTHPAFETNTTGFYTPPPTKLDSEQWMRDFISRNVCPDYEDLMALVASRADLVDEYSDADFLLVGGMEAHGDIPPEFWDHAATILGRPIRGKRATRFSCTC